MFTICSYSYIQLGIYNHMWASAWVCVQYRAQAGCFPTYYVYIYIYIYMTILRAVRRPGRPCAEKTRLE